MHEEDTNKKEGQENLRKFYIKVGALIGLVLILGYAKLIWPFIYGRMRNEGMGFFEAVAGEQILVGGLIGLVLLVAASWVWAGRNQ